MTSPEEQGNVVMQLYGCRCHNITINAYDTSTGSTETDYHRVFVGEDSIHIVRRLPLILSNIGF